jgi:hypothetical protein
MKNGSGRLLDKLEDWKADLEKQIDYSVSNRTAFKHRRILIRLNEVEFLIACFEQGFNPVPLRLEAIQCAKRALHGHNAQEFSELLEFYHDFENPTKKIEPSEGVECQDA